MMTKKRREVGSARKLKNGYITAILLAGETWPTETEDSMGVDSIIGSLPLGKEGVYGGGQGTR